MDSGYGCARPNDNDQWTLRSLDMLSFFFNTSCVTQPCSSIPTTTQTHHNFSTYWNDKRRMICDMEKAF